MKIETQWRTWRRFVILGFLFFAVLGIIDRMMLRNRLDEIKNQLVLDVLRENKTLSNELHAVLHGVQDDFNFIEKKIKHIFAFQSHKEADLSEVKSMVEFLETHAGYFKTRFVDEKGQEVFKIVLNPDGKGFSQSKELFQLADQQFYQELNQVTGDEFYFSSMEANIINGIVEKPIRPTIRVSKRITYKNSMKGLLVFNIDGQRVLKLFSSVEQDQTRLGQTALVDGEGQYIASIPQLSPESYTVNKFSLNKISPKLFETLKNEKNDQGSFELSNQELVVYTQIHLPFTNERWFLVSRFPELSWEKLILKERATWIFWEALCFILVLTWVWKDEKKRHRDEVVKVLLKERGEFIQNVSHQLKTPLAILTNSLEKKRSDSSDWIELKKDVNHLTTVVEDMLLLAQVDAIQHLPLKNEDLLEIVGSAIEMAAPKALEKKLQIRFNIADSINEQNHRLEISVMGDLFKSAILNLLDNAIDFSPVGGRIDVSLSLDKGKTIIGIKDQGPGVPPEFISKLFERFSRGDRSRPGSGLGLAITKKIVDLHGGQIVFKDNSDGAYFEIII